MSFCHKVKRKLDKYQVYEWMPVYSALTLILPAITHYQQQEIYTSLFIVGFALLRSGYHLDIVIKDAPMTIYHISYVVFSLLVHFNLIVTAVTYRRDITSMFMLALAVYKSMAMLWQLPEIFDMQAGIYKDSMWNIYMGAVFVWNLVMHKGGMATVFIKGLFWGAYFCRFAMTGHFYPFGYLRERWTVVSKFMPFIQLAPFTHSPRALSPQRAFPVVHTTPAEKHTLPLPPDDLD